MHLFKKVLLLGLISLLMPLVTAELPENSLYQIDSEWKTQNAESIQLKDLSGKKDHFSFVLISLTPESDTPEVLKTFAEERGLDADRWTLLQGDKKSVHLLAMALETEYKALADGEVSHSNLISVLDEQGQILFQAKGTSSQVTDLIEKVKTL